MRGVLYPDDVYFTVEVHEDFQGQGIGEEAVSKRYAEPPAHWAWRAD
jgi:ribosomal protein S18 acetylase RimI-like enzyme